MDKIGYTRANILKVEFVSPDNQAEVVRLRVTVQYYGMTENRVKWINPEEAVYFGFHQDGQARLEVPSGIRTRIDREVMEELPYWRTSPVEFIRAFYARA